MSTDSALALAHFWLLLLAIGALAQELAARPPAAELHQKSSLPPASGPAPESAPSSPAAPLKTASSVGGLAPTNPLARLRALVESCTREASRAVNSLLAPKVEYLKLVQRYHRWYQRYRLQAGPAHEHLSAGDLLSIRFAEVDRELYAELHERALKLKVTEALRRRERGRRARPPGSGTQRADPEQVALEEMAGQRVAKSFENTDYLFEALRRLIARLEEELEAEGPAPVAELAAVNSESVEGQEPDLAATEHARLRLEAMRDTREFRAAMDRVRRIALNAAQGVLAHELLQVGKLAALDALASHVTNSPPTPGTSLAYLAPLVHLLGSANTPLVVSYLTSLEIRTAMNIVDGINPLPHLVRGALDRFSRRPADAAKELDDTDTRPRDN